MSVAIGAALAKKLNGEDTIVYSLHGDGELDEGQNWEAIMFAAHQKVDNLISTVDWNGQQIDGPTHKVMNLGDLPAKFEAFGWEVLLLPNGNDLTEVIATLEDSKNLSRKRKAHRHPDDHGYGQPVLTLWKAVMNGTGFLLTTNN